VITFSLDQDHSIGRKFTRFNSLLPRAIWDSLLNGNVPWVSIVPQGRSSLDSVCLSLEMLLGVGLLPVDLFPQGKTSWLALIKCSPNQDHSSRR
jgi:hypothetical protein